jgi:hypothetical protein
VRGGLLGLALVIGCGGPAGVEPGVTPAGRGSAIAASVAPSAMTPQVTSTEVVAGTVEASDDAEGWPGRPHASGFVPVSPWLKGASVWPLGELAVETRCGRASRTEAVTLVDGQERAVARLGELIAAADARPEGERFPPWCVAWVVGASLDDMHAALYMPGKYGLTRDGRLWRFRGGAWHARRTTRPRLFAARWGHRVVTLVRHRGGGAELEDVYPQGPSQAPPLAHYRLEVLGPKGVLVDQPLEHRVRKRCADGSFGSRLVEPSHLVVAPDGHVVVMGRDCLKTREHPAFDDGPAAPAMEIWGPGGGVSRWLELPATADGETTVVAASGRDMWLHGERAGLLHFDGTAWAEVAAPGAVVVDLAASPDGDAWLIDAGGMLWRRSPAGAYEAVAAPKATVVAVMPSSEDKAYEVSVGFGRKRAWRKRFAWRSR